MADYTTHTVSAGDEFVKNIGSGETWENHLIDITASGASHQIQADGSNWTIRNVAIRGTMSGGHTEPFRARDTGDGTSTIENVYLGDGTTDSNATGIYVYWNHSGHIDFRNVYVGGWTDNGVYASGAGNPPSHSVSGHGGTVTYENCYAFDNAKSNLRAGTDGSEAVNCVMVDGHNRGYWGFYNHTELIDCDIVDSGSDIAISDSAWDDPAEVTCTNTRWQTETAHGTQSTSQIHGTSAGTPQDRIPSGCPTTAEEAASGEGGSNGGGTTPGGLAIATASATNVTREAMTLHGYVDDMGDHDSATIWLEWRVAGSVSWNKVSEETVSSAEDISSRVHGLDPWTEYEYRAVGDAGEDERTGDTLSTRTVLDTDPLDMDFSDGMSVFEGDTGAFDVGGTLTPAGSSDSDAIIWRPDMETSWGNTYAAEITHTKSSGGDVGLLFGVQPDTDGWGSFRGYFLLFETDDDEVVLGRLSNGDRDGFDSQSATLPLDEQTTTYIDYRDSSDSTITVTVEDASGSQIASVDLDDTQYDSGYGGFYRWHADGGWEVDSFYDVGESTSHPTTVNHGSGEEAVSGIETDRGRVTRMLVNHNDGNGEQVVFRDGS